ncbi:EAL domain-containing protein [Oxalobacter vibrioformis]|uniref:EAL domain-containing protein n=1 Tax=Oxalobacter vibrioformis TaxID=933080 RepID=A0A9E9P2S8_9BURK|nr:EAL domain-containing protein [Oxalobacter vibrioformis]WAW09328.1 EAL domain-containing protein [Oxalobacter vibrioformis]
MMEIWGKLSLRIRLILVFVVIKVLLLLLLGWMAWSHSYQTAKDLTQQAEHLVEMADETIQYVGDTAIADAVAALDSRAREEIERQTTDTARAVADFLYGRDADISYARSLEPSVALYRNFIENKQRDLIYHGEWKLAEDGKSWEPVDAPKEGGSSADPGSPDNAKDFHYRQPVPLRSKRTPLYLEMTFVGLDGKERIKVTTSDRVSSALKDVSNRMNTFARAETYFNELKKLKPGDIYVSDVIGTYVGSKIIGHYTPETAAKKGIAYEPENSAYAGKENPVGKRFKGIVRWATPVVRGGQITGWVTLALNHDHLMSFTDTIVPTSERYRDINDASDGNYAFIGDYKGRSIVHPRHHSITGYNAETGEPEVPWLEDVVYEEWKRSGMPYTEFIKTAPTFVNQLQSRKPAKELTDAGNVGLDCRWLNFAPQCTGWYNLANSGGSGSFLILWSGLWKLTTTAAIPYYTGQYSPEAAGNKRGFGIVTIGANVDDFHRAANESKARLDLVIAKADQAMLEQGRKAEKTVQDGMTKMAYSLIISTLVMVGIVIVIAIWMASFLSSRIKWLNAGFNRFRLKEGVNICTQKESELREIKDNLEIRIAERTQELSEINGLLRGEIEIRRAAEAKAQHLASHDPLTGLANRLLFHERLQKAMHQASRSRKAGALLFFDLDRFKQVNDTLGHAIGDALLVNVAQVLQQRSRKTDTVARLGGDEFAVIMTDLAAPDDAAILAQQILDQLDQAVTLDGHELRIYTSIGIATFSGEDTDIEHILMHADMAMYQAKTEGGTRFRFFEESMQNKIQARKQMEAELRTALEERQFVPYFQPIFDTEEKRGVSVEALVRWAHPDHGILMPGEFMDVAILSGMMPEIDARMLEMACKQAKQWLDDGVDFGRVSINILPEKISSPDFVDYIRKVLDQTKLPASKLALEITERALLEDRDQVIGNLSSLRQMGASVSIDDFGIEYSSLQRLVEYPIDVLKIDRFFVRRVGNSKTEAIIHAIIAMARSIGMEIVAEGVESKTQLDYLIGRDCRIIQGYLHARPMSSADTTRHLLSYADNTTSS